MCQAVVCTEHLKSENEIGIREGQENLQREARPMTEIHGGTKATEMMIVIDVETASERLIVRKNENVSEIGIEVRNEIGTETETEKESETGIVKLGEGLEVLEEEKMIVTGETNVEMIEGLTTAMTEETETGIEIETGTEKGREIETGRKTEIEIEIGIGKGIETEIETTASTRNGTAIISQAASKKEIETGTEKETAMIEIAIETETGRANETVSLIDTPLNASYERGRWLLVSKSLPLQLSLIS